MQILGRKNFNGQFLFLIWVRARARASPISEVTLGPLWDCILIGMHAIVIVRSS